MALKEVHKLNDRERLFALFNQEDKSATDIKLDTDTFCPNCHHILDENNGLIECGHCNIVLGSSTDQSAEWRNDITNGKDMTRCGLPTNNMMVESSYGVSFSYDGRRQITRDLYRISNWTKIPTHEKSLQNRFDNIEWKCRAYGINQSIIEYTQYIYYEFTEKRAEDSNQINNRGDNNEGLQAAALYKAFKDDGKPKTHKEIAKIFNIDPKYVSNGIKLLKEFLKIETNKYSDYIEGFCNKLQLNEVDIERVNNVADKAHKLGILNNNTPSAIVAGCIYYVVIESGNLTISKQHIAKSCNISIPTIVQVCDKLCYKARELL